MPEHSKIEESRSSYKRAADLFEQAGKSDKALECRRRAQSPEGEALPLPFDRYRNGDFDLHLFQKGTPEKPLLEPQSREGDS